MAVAIRHSTRASAADPNSRRDTRPSPFSCPISPKCWPDSCTPLTAAQQVHGRFEDRKAVLWMEQQLLQCAVTGHEVSGEQIRRRPRTRTPSRAPPHLIVVLSLASLCACRRRPASRRAHLHDPRLGRRPRDVRRRHFLASRSAIGRRPPERTRAAPPPPPDARAAAAR